MRYNTTKQKVLELFFDFPLARMHLREIARRIKISAPAVSRALVDLEKEEYIELEKRFLVYAKATNKNKFRIKFSGGFCFFECFIRSNS